MEVIINKTKETVIDTGRVIKQKLKTTAEESNNLIHEFSDVTTLHGVRYLGDRSANSCEKGVWLIALCVCFLLCLDEITNTWKKWETSQVVVSYAQERMEITKINMPALTICPENKVKKSIVDMQSNFTEFQALLRGEKHYDSNEHKILVESIGMMCLETSNQYNLALPVDLKPSLQHLKAITTQISLQMEDIFEACYFESELIDCADIFRPILTSFGMCYTFNTPDDNDLYTEKYNKFPFDILWFDNETSMYNFNKFENTSTRELQKLQKLPGPYYGLRVELKNSYDDLQQFCSIRNADAIRFTVHKSGAFPDPLYGNFHHAMPGVETSISLSPFIFKTSEILQDENYDRKIRGCHSLEEKPLVIFANYTASNCQRECVYHYLESNCQCHPYYSPINENKTIPYCNVSSSRMLECDNLNGTKWMFDIEELNSQIFKTTLCDCPPECNDIDFTFQVSYTDFSNSKYHFKSNMTTIRMYFESDTVLVHHRNEMYGVTDFLANCGGLLAFFTGFSIITLFEVIYFATIRFVLRLKRKLCTNEEEETQN